MHFKARNPRQRGPPASLAFTPRFGMVGAQHGIPACCEAGEAEFDLSTPFTCRQNSPWVSKAQGGSLVQPAGVDVVCTSV